MSRMPGRASQSWCPSCCGPPGLDCGDIGRSPRQIRRQLQRELDKEFDEYLFAVNNEIMQALSLVVDTEADLCRLKKKVGG